MPVFSESDLDYNSTTAREYSLQTTSVHTSSCPPGIPEATSSGTQTSRLKLNITSLYRPYCHTVYPPLQSVGKKPSPKPPTRNPPFPTFPRHFPQRDFTSMSPFMYTVCVPCSLMFAGCPPIHYIKRSFSPDKGCNQWISPRINL